MYEKKENPGSHRGNSLGNETREWMLQRDIGYLALALDALYHAGVIPGTHVSQQSLVEIALRDGFSVDALNRALKLGVFPKQAQTGTGGRHGTIVYIPSPQQVAMWYGLPIDGRSDRLPAWAYASVTAYRMAVHYALIARYSRQRAGKVSKSIEWFARRLGVSRRTVQRYNAHLKAMNLIDYSAHHTMSEIPAGAGYYSFPPVRSYRWYIHGVSPAGKAFKFPGIRALASKLQKDGWQLWKVSQHCNIYWTVTDEPV